MDKDALKELLERLIAQWENEVVEFKEAGDNYSTSDIGKYFSALANEANLRSEERAWFVIGVNNKSRQVVGTDYRLDPERLQSLKYQISQGTDPSVTLREIHTLAHDDGRVIMLEIPSAPRGMPIGWNGHCYARAGESLVALGMDKQDEIRQQVSGLDWTSQIVPDASLEDLDEAALAHAKSTFARKHANRVSLEEVQAWPDLTFLDRTKLTFRGQITRTTLLLLGKPESSVLLSPHPAQLTWGLEGEETAYTHFGPPFLLATTALYQEIRNVQIRVLPDDALLPVEVSKYDQSVVLEALHNCIAHQDYTLSGRVVVTEHNDRLTFENTGKFFEGEPHDYITGKKTPLRYRNPFLAQAMAEMNMIDTMGYGIARMFKAQAARYFPLPDYDLGQPEQVKMIVYGRVLDPAYSRILIQKTDLLLQDVLALDRVQKKQPLDGLTVRRLRKAGLVEGHKPNLHVSASIAQASGNKADYIRTRAQDDDFYRKQTIDFIEKFGSASRDDIEKLLLDKLSDGLNQDQKTSKISNLLAGMRRKDIIKNIGSRKASKWVLGSRTPEK